MRRPLLRFALLGALLFAADFGWSARRAPVEAPAPGTVGARAELPDDELLFREALARGWHRSDAIVQRRLARNMRFALESRGAAQRGDAALVREAIALGMHRSDRVVRRRLVQKLRLQIHAGARAQEPSEAELAAYLARHAARWTEPARRSLTQLYFRKRRDAEAARSALPALPALSAPSDSPAPHAPAPEAEAGALPAGDALPLPRHLAGRSRAELERLFGPDFASAAFRAPDAVWSGPIASSYGYHLVWIHQRRAAVLSKLSVVRPEVREALLYERGEAALRGELATLRARAQGAARTQNGASGADGAPDSR
ncbi:MAG: peptidylprolyl isomerase [Deltaproteobacteria bacterium]|nr:peptidylprolyl isomerase [Deltaproteobacteria bacterium]